LSIAAPLLLVLASSIAVPAGAAAEEPAAEATRRRGEAYFHLMRARLALAGGRASEVAREVQAAVERDPDRAELYGEGSLLLALAGRRTDAEAMARKALALDPDQSAALRVLADLFAGRSFGPAADPEARLEAIRLYERLVRVEERVPDEIWMVLARLRQGAGDGDGAVAGAREFLARRPGEPGAVRLLAQTLEAVGRKEEALDVLLEWVRDHPDEDGLLGWISEWAREVDRWRQVDEAMTAVLDKRPEAPGPLGLRGEARLRLDRVQEAVADLERAYRASPESVLVRFQLATAYGAANRLADAVETARALAADLPDNAAVRGMLGDALARQGDRKGAEEAYEAALRAVPGEDPESAARRDDLRRRRALLRIAAKDAAGAVRALDAVEDPDDPQILEVRAEIDLLANDPAGVRARAAALRSAGRPVEAAYFEGRAFLLEGRPDRATVRFEEATKEGGPAVRVRGAAALLDAGHAARGERLLREWVRAEPHDPEAHFQLGAFLERAREFDRAEPVLREALRLAPDDAEILNHLGYSLADRGIKLEEAHALIRRAVGIDPWNGAFQDSLGWVLYRLGRFEEAREPLERAAREVPFDPTVLEHLGDLYERLGSYDRAEAAWARALEVGGERVREIRAKIERLARGAAEP
jgi:tetratricopeptide (TPR) repeat protein